MRGRLSQGNRSVEALQAMGSCTLNASEAKSLAYTSGISLARELLETEQDAREHRVAWQASGDRLG